MKRSVLLALLAAGCATTSTQGDMRTIETSLSERAQLSGFSLPRFDVPDEVSEDADKLLSRPLTADDAVRIALLANPHARATLAEVGIARGELVQAGLIPNPEFELGVRESGNAQPIQLDLGLEYALTDALLAPMRASIAEAQLEAARLRAAGALLELTAQTRMAFYEVQARQQKLDLRLRALASSQASYATAIELTKAGNLPALELANELAGVELARVQVAEAENALLDAREALNRWLGVTGKRTGWTVAGPLAAPVETPSSADAEAKAIGSNLMLLELQRRAEAAARKIGLAKTEAWMPSLSGGFHGERDGDLWELGAHFTVSLPVFDRAQGHQLSAKSEYEMLRARAESSALMLRSSVRATLNRVESAGRRARHYAERLVPARQAQLDQTLLQYNAMQLNVFQLLQVQRSVTEAAIGQVDATLDYWKARTGFDVLLAGREVAMGSLPMSGGGADVSTSSQGH